jgi:hypothetical protein
MAAPKKKKKWMQEAFGSNPGALHRQLNVAEDEPIPAKKIAAAKKKATAKGDTKTLRRLALAKTGKKYGGGQDDAILGEGVGRPGGHAGYGHGVAGTGG